MRWSPVPDLISPGRPARVALLVAGFWALVQTLRGYSQLALSLNDTDDALRLVMVRGLLETGHWFDGPLARLQPPLGIDMHWSRLVDGGLALVYGASALMLPPAAAETAMRLVWPLIWIFPLVLGAVLVARRLGGSAAVLAAAIFIGCVPVLFQFSAGRIDHHNVQMALAMLMLAGTVDLEARWGPGLAGIASGVMLAVGLEALLFAAICGAAVALRLAAAPQFAPAARRYALALGTTAFVAFFAQTSPRLWLAGACDMLSVNLLAGLLVAAACLYAASFVRGAPAVRLAAVGAAGLGALAIYFAIEPSCLGGPYAAMDPLLRPFWLDHVAEVQTWPALLADNPAVALAFAGPLVIAVASVVFAGMRGAPLLRDPGWITMLAVFAASAVSGLAMVRMLSYGAAFGAVLFAAALPHLLPRRIGDRFVATTIVALIVSPAVVTTAILLATESTAHRTAGKSADAAACRASGAFAALGSLTPGLVLADIDAGPHLLAHTPHSVLAAPYHRMNDGIIAAHLMWSAPPDEAVGQMRERGVDYVMLCPARGRLPVRFPEGGLRATLERGMAPDGLERVDAGGTFQVWRVR